MLHANSPARLLLLLLKEFHQALPLVDVLTRTKTQSPFPGLQVTLVALPSLVTVFHTSPLVMLLQEKMLPTLVSTCKTRELSVASNKALNTLSSSLQLVLLATATLRHSNAELLLLNFHQVLPSLTASTKVTTKLLLHGNLHSTLAAPPLLDTMSLTSPLVKPI